MAWYYGEYSCGHEGRVNVVGPTKNRQWKVDRHFENKCEECIKKDFEKENEKAMEESKELELPDLQGTEKQVAWASKIRLEIINKLNSVESVAYFNDDYEKISLDSAELVDYIMSNKTSAAWWIDYRRGLNLERLHNEMIELNDKETENLIDDKDEYTVYPEEFESNVPAEITIVDNVIKVKFEKNDKFIKLVKNLDYSWNGVWSREITQTNGDINDRIVELGNKLLIAGFAITIYDKELLSKAIEGEYEEECFNWIYKRCDTNKLVIKWKGMSDRLYKQAKSLPGAKWDSGMLVSVKHYEEVEDFASINGFKFTQKAIELIDIERGKIKNVIIPVEKEITKETKEDNFEVLDDLKD